MKNKNLIYCIVILAIIVVVLWKLVYKNGFKKNESSYLYLDGSYYLKPEWQDSWPNW